MRLDTFNDQLIPSGIDYLMPPSDSEEENLEELEYDGEDDPDADAEDDPLDVGPDDATEEGDDVCCLAHLSETSFSYGVSHIGFSIGRF